MSESNSHETAPSNSHERPSDGFISFGPASAHAMAFVLAEVCDDLNIEGDTAKEIIAIRLIELARNGIRDPAQLRRN